jgi:phenylacetic acid degradation operon negative regulatory protein
LKARSVVFDLFADYLRYRGGEVRLRGLIALMDCFEVREATVRVVVTRLRREGWLSSRRDGRETTYLLTEKSWQALDEKRSRIFQRVDEPWDGLWHTVIYSVPETERALREQLRRKLQWLGFGPLAQSVWVSPHDRVAEVREAFADNESVRLDLFHARSEDVRHDRDIVSRAWDLSQLNQDYNRLLAHYRPQLEHYRAGELVGSAALGERMRLVYDYRRFPFRDPDLPPELLPDGWAGRAAHEVFLQAHSLLRAPAEAYVDDLIGADRMGHT